MKKKCDVTRKQIVVIDGKYMGYKMYYSHLSLKSNGRPTGMLHGFLTGLLSLNKKLPEARLIICWDGEKPTWRHKAYSRYKANRKVNPLHQGMKEQTQLLLPILKKLGLWVLKLDEVEADDMIGMVATLFSRHGDEVRIYSKDHDMFQLVDNNVWIWPDPKFPPLKVKDVEQWLGAPLSAILDIRAMAGDSSDNLRGLPGVGLKTAAKLWQKLNGTTTEAKEVREKYEEHWGRVAREKQLARIITDHYSDVWSKETSSTLGALLHNVCVRPERDADMAWRNRREVYSFLAEYDLNQLLNDRHLLFRLP